MVNEIGKNKKKKDQRKALRLKILNRQDFCACGGGHKLKCEGICRELHTNPSGGLVECGEMYNMDTFIVQNDDIQKQKRSWRFGRQKNVKENTEGGDNRVTKQRRRDKIDRDRS